MAKRGYTQKQEENKIQGDFWEIRNALNVVSTGQQQQQHRDSALEPPRKL